MQGWHCGSRIARSGFGRGSTCLQACKKDGFRLCCSIPNSNRTIPTGTLTGAMVRRNAISSRRFGAIRGYRWIPTYDIGFARCMTGYNRPPLLFEDVKRLRAIARKRPSQMFLAGKAHPKDHAGKDAIRRLHEVFRELSGDIEFVILPEYEMRLAKRMVSRSDFWLTTPLPPMEASGTSRMRAALNGVLDRSAPRRLAGRRLHRRGCRPAQVSGIISSRCGTLRDG